ncbi:MAG: molybdopterin-synthase adenylyltransferase MoeB [Verrucomicrobia bacterium]|nr:molybdopterin-synthase adenylyltransferase MoeB [Verrucomicrobiota bacterium]
MADPLPSLSPAELARYSRHILLGEIGVEGQRRLAAARVLVVGAGGLGSPAALYLAAAGVGTLGIADFDRVADHNLQRQLLHDEASVGQPKVASAVRRLRATNPFITVVGHEEGVTVDNALALFAGYDVIVDGTDNFSSRYLNNDAAFFAKKPLVYGSVFKFEGQVSVFDSAHGGPCYRCLFPEPPAPGSVPGCGEAGVLGALCGVVGSLQALEAIKLITGIGRSLVGRLLTYNALTQDFQTLTLPRDPQCPLCGTAPKITSLLPELYTAACAPTPVPSSTTMPDTDDYPLEISVTEAKRLLDQSPCGVLLIDVREPYEVEIASVTGAEKIPMGQIPAHAHSLPRDEHLLIMCHHGGRSLRVTQYLRAQGYTAVTNVAGGIDAWAEQIDPAMRRY